MDLQNKKTNFYLIAGAGILLILAICSLCIGRYPLSLRALRAGDVYQLKIFYNLRLSRVIVGVAGGFVLGVAGYVFQIIFHNPLAAPDMIGVSSGASAGAAFGILFFGVSYAVTLSAFAGALLSVILAILLAMTDRSRHNSTIVLAGIVVHALSQTLLMCLKLTADPERELAAIEYWIMGSLNAISTASIRLNLVLALLCLCALFLLHRQLLLLASGEEEAGFLGVNVTQMRLLILLITTLMVASVISLTGLLSFVGLIAPHCARLLTHRNNAKTMALAGILGGIVLCLADVFARSVAHTELPVSIFTSLIGAPFLVALVVRRRSA